MDDLRIEMVTSCGCVLLRMPGGGGMAFAVSPELAPYYRRLATPSTPADEPPEAQQPVPDDDP